MEVTEKQRTLQQNKSLHLYFELLAEYLNNAGLDQKKVLKPEIEIPWTKDAVKQQLWKSIQKAMFPNKPSTADLTSTELNEIEETLNRHLGLKFGVRVDFPSIETLMIQNEKD